MDAGMLNERITIESRAAGVDAAGQPNGAWSSFAIVWANVKGQTGMAVIRQSEPLDGVARALDSYSFRVRYRTDITTAMRINYRSRYFDIKHVKLDYDRKDYTDLVCEVGGNEG